MTGRILALSALVACGGRGEDPGREAFRVSMALRGVPPDAAEVARVRDDPEALDRLTDQWLTDPRFAETIADQHAEFLWLRHDTQEPLPAIGALEGEALGAIADSVAEAPLRRLAMLVAADRPYTELFAGRQVAVDRVGARIWGLTWQEGGPEWQLATRPGDQPAAGILGDPNLWMRHTSSDTNHQRGRANLVHRAWLCEDLASRPLDLEGVDLSDPAVVGEAVRDDPGCSGCHATLDPLAASFAGWRRYAFPREVTDAHAAGCEDADYCYPLRLWAPEELPSAAELGLPPAALAGRPVGDLDALAAALVEDPRFAPCVARRMAAYLGQEELEEVPSAEVDRLARVFVDGGYRLAPLARAVVRSERFAASGGEVGPLFARPEQVARTVEARTGFVWRGDPDRGVCREAGCWGAVELGTNARWGYRDVGGGQDGYDSLHPVHAPQPMRHLAVGRMAEEAAGWVVAHEAGLAPRDRRLLREVEPTERDPDALDAQLVALHERILAVDATRADRVAAEALWRDVLERSGSPERAWAAVIAAMLQSPELGVY